jgi:sugar phosphate isomerase/epimerase
MRISASVADKPGVFSPFLFVGDLFHGMDRAVALGYDAVELFVLDPLKLGIERIADGVRARGLAVSAVGPGLASYQYGWLLTEPDVEKRRNCVERIKDGVRLAAQFPTSVNIGGTRGTLAGDPDLRRRQRGWFLEAIQECAEFAGPLGVQLGIEPLNRYETNYLNTVAEALEFVVEADRPNVGLLLDTFHMNIEEPSLDAAIAVAGDRLVNVHLVDSNRWAPGFGHTDLKSVVSKLRAIGYDRFLSMEILRLPSAEEAAAQALKHARELLRATQESAL